MALWARHAGACGIARECSQPTAAALAVAAAAEDVATGRLHAVDWSLQTEHTRRRLRCVAKQDRDSTRQLRHRTAALSRCRRDERSLVLPHDVEVVVL